MARLFRKYFWFYLGFFLIISLGLVNLIIGAVQERNLEVSQFRLNELVDDKLIQMQAVAAISENSEKIFFNIYEHSLSCDFEHMHDLEAKTESLILQNSKLIDKVETMGFKDTSLKRVFLNVINMRELMLESTENVLSTSQTSDPEDTSFRKKYARHKQIEDRYRVSLNVFETGLLKRTRIASILYGRDMIDSGSVIQLIVTITVILLILSVFVFGFIVHRLRLDNTVLESEVSRRTVMEGQLNKSLEHSSALLSEIHHRVKNNLAVISGLMQIKAFNSKEPAIKEVMMRFQNRVHAIAKVHELLYQSDNFAHISMKNYLEAVIQDYRILHCEGECPEFLINCPEFNLDMDKAISLGLIINELIDNSLTHSSKRNSDLIVTINIEIPDKNICHLIYKDNGLGFDPKSFEHKGSTLGSEMIRALLQQIKASYTFESRNGLHFEVKFNPLKILPSVR
ncbi:MAG: sensor histidine kinase [Bacteroidales bacterium]|nr:sensor histidine kinase [Bacteroidales bacterium]